MTLFFLLILGQTFHVNEWNAPQPLTAVNSPGWEDSLCVQQWTDNGKTVTEVSFCYSRTDLLKLALQNVTRKPGPTRTGYVDSSPWQVDLCVSRSVDGGPWTPPQVIPSPISTPNNMEGCQWLSRGQGAVFFSNSPINSQGRPQGLYASLNIGGWRPPVFLPEPVNVKGSTADNPFLAGTTLYFDSDRAGTKDLYFVEDGQAKPVEAVNSPAAEVQPFVTDDGGWLYFTRDLGGGGEIWRSQRIGDAWGKPQRVVSGLVGEPNVTPDGTLWFIKVNVTGDPPNFNPDIYFATRRK